MCSPPPVPVPAGVFSERRDWTWHDTPEQIAAAMLQLGLMIFQDLQALC